MSEYIARRFGYSVAALLLIITIVFLLLHISGDPAAMLASPEATKADIEQLRLAYGLNQPLYVQYVRYLAQVLRGDLGYSYRQDLPVTELLADHAGATLELAVAGLVFAIVAGVPLGTLAARWRGSGWDACAMFASLVGVSMPSFWLGLLLIIVFGVGLKWLPVSGFGDLRHLLMPAIVMGGYYAAQVARLTRNSLLEVLAQDYVRTARAKGVVEYIVLFRHALRNAALPIFTVLGLSFGQMLGGAVIIETIFAWPGMGRLAVQAMLGRDFPVVQGVTVVGAAIFLCANFFVDLMYGWIDPRLRA